MKTPEPQGTILTPPLSDCISEEERIRRLLQPTFKELYRQRMAAFIYAQEDWQLFNTLTVDHPYRDPVPLARYSLALYKRLQQVAKCDLQIVQVAERHKNGNLHLHELVAFKGIDWLEFNNRFDGRLLPLLPPKPDETRYACRKMTAGVANWYKRQEAHDRSRTLGWPFWMAAHWTQLTRGGIARAEYIKSNDGVSDYVTKYVLKGDYGRGLDWLELICLPCKGKPLLGKKLDALDL